MNEVLPAPADRNFRITAEIGKSGIRKYSGYIDEEFQRKGTEASAKARRGKPLSEEHKRKLSLSTLGRPRPANDAQRASQKRRYQENKDTHPLNRTGLPPWNKGVPWSKEILERLSAIKIDAGKWSMEDNPNWRGGVYEWPYAPYKHLRSALVERDGEACKMEDESCKGLLSIHHVDFDKQNNSLENLVIVCASHNTRANYHPEWAEALKP